MAYDHSAFIRLKDPPAVTNCIAGLNYCWRNANCILVIKFISNTQLLELWQYDLDKQEITKINKEPQ